MTVQLLGEPLAAVDHDVHGEGEPGLEPDIQPAELRINQIKVMMQTLSRERPQFEPLQDTIGTHRECQARLDTGQHTDQPLGDPIVLRNATGKLLFPRAAARQILQWPSRLIGQSRGRLLNRIREIHRVFLEVLK